MALLLPHVELLLDQLRLRVVQTLGAPPEESAASAMGILTRHQQTSSGGGGGASQPQAQAAAAAKAKAKRVNHAANKVHVPMRELTLLQRLVPHVGMSHARAVRVPPPCAWGFRV